MLTAPSGLLRTNLICTGTSASSVKQPIPCDCRFMNKAYFLSVPRTRFRKDSSFFWVLFLKKSLAMKASAQVITSWKLNGFLHSALRAVYLSEARGHVGLDLSIAAVEHLERPRTHEHFLGAELWLDATCELLQEGVQSAAVEATEERLLLLEMDEGQRVAQVLFAVAEHGERHLADQVQQEVVW